MGHRLSKIYTRTGDQGTTGLGDGSRVEKDHPRIEALGTVDELNSIIGVMMTEPLPEAVNTYLTDIQHTLFDIGGELSMPGHSLVADEKVDELEAILDTLNESLSPLKDFILPGGTKAAALCHLARTVCRRAERRIFSLSKSVSEAGSVSETPRRYLNRLSDLLFVMARHLNQDAGQNDVLWRHKR